MAARLQDFGLSTLMGPNATHVSNFDAGKACRVAEWRPLTRHQMAVVLVGDVAQCRKSLFCRTAYLIDIRHCDRFLFIANFFCL
jgi:hypothetical protein